MILGAGFTVLPALYELHRRKCYQTSGFLSRHISWRKPHGLEKESELGVEPTVGLYSGNYRITKKSFFEPGKKADFE
jgi:hypothetical protein